MSDNVAPSGGTGIKNTDEEIRDGVLNDATKFAGADIADVKNIVTLRTATSGSKAIDAGGEKYLNIDSGTNHAEILSIITKGVASANWVLEMYIPTDDGIGSPAAGDKREEITWDTVAEAGLISGVIGIPYNMFLKFTNNAGAPDNIDDVIVVCRSVAALTLTWEE